MKLVSQVGLLTFLASSGILHVSTVEAFVGHPRLAVAERGHTNKLHAVFQKQGEEEEERERERQQRQQLQQLLSPLKPSSSTNTFSRRNLFEKTASSAVMVAGVTTGSFVLPGAPKEAYASGGATAGKYTTIPIAKRRYYGRVQAAVHEFLLIGPEVVKADFSSSKIQGFFDPSGLVVVEKKRQDVNGQCTKKDGKCKGAEIRDSYYNDMKTSMYLLGNAFRLNQTKAPDNLPTVRAAKRFFKEMDAVEKAAKKGRKNDRDSVIRYAAALEALNEYLDLVELPPTDSGWYEREFSRAVGDSARIT